MMRGIKHHIVLVCTLLLLGCEEWDLVSSEEEGKLLEVQFTGHIYERAEVSLPIQDAEVVINGYHTTTDVDGYYSLRLNVSDAQVRDYLYDLRAPDFQMETHRENSTDKLIKNDFSLERIRFVDISASQINMGLFERVVALRIRNETSSEVDFHVSIVDGNITFSPASGTISSSHASHSFVDVILEVDRTIFTSGVRNSTINLEVGDGNYTIVLVYETRNPDDLHWVDEDQDRLIDIRNIDDLYRLSFEHSRDTFNAFVGFELVNDLDFEAASNYKDLSLKNQLTNGEGWLPIGYERDEIFTRKFEGNGYFIKNLMINRSSNYLGLFAHTSETATISNLALIDVSVKGEGYCGGLVGSNRGNIDTCSVIGVVEGEYSAGLLIGWHKNGRVSYSCSSGLTKTLNDNSGGLVGILGQMNSDVPVLENCYSLATVKGNSFVGGLVGRRYSGSSSVTSCYARGQVIANGRSIGGLVGAYNGIMTNCYATGSVESNSYYIGGLIGENHGVITSSYAVGEVVGESNVGGFIGRNRGSVANTSYWDITSSKLTTSYGGMGYPTTTLQGITSDVSIYLTWDEDSWDFGTTAQYPALKNMPGGLEIQRE